MNYGKKIRDMRLRQGITQHDLEGALKLKASIVSSWERVSYPPLQAIEKVCQYFDVPLYEFFGGSGAIPEQHPDYEKLSRELDSLLEPDREYVMTSMISLINYLKSR